MISERKVKAVLTHGAKTELFYAPGAVAKRVAIEVGRSGRGDWGKRPFAQTLFSAWRSTSQRRAIVAARI